MQLKEVMNLQFQNARVIGSDFSYEEYSAYQGKRGDAAYVMTRGQLMEFNHCPARWLAGYESPESKPMEYGNLIDCLALTPEAFDKRFITAPATYVVIIMECPSCGSQTDSKTCRKCGVNRLEKTIEKEWDWNASACRDWKENHKGKSIVKPSAFCEAGIAVNKLMNDPRISSLIISSNKQVWVFGFYRDHATGISVPVQCLIDLVPNTSSEYGKALSDLKTSNSADTYSWAKKVHSCHYDAQAALSLDLYTAATGEDRTDWLHVIQESYPPYQVGRRLLSAEFVDFGRNKILSALKRYAMCLATNEWPDYDSNPNEMVLDGWTITQPEPWMIQL